MLRPDTWVVRTAESGFVLDETVAEVFTHLREGRSVRLVGDSGAGRSSVLAKCAALIEATGRTALTAHGEPAARLEPGYGLQQIGFQTTSRSPHALVDMIAASIAVSGPTVLLIDDTSELDELSLRVLETVRDRTGVAMMRAERGGRARRTGFRAHWPEVEVRVPALRLDQVGLLMATLVDGPVDLRIITSVLTASGGNPRFVRAIVDLAIRRGTIQFQNGRWGGQLPPLADELGYLVDAHIGNDPEVRAALRWLSLRGPLAADAAESRLGFVTLDDLRARGLVVDLPSERGSPVVHVWPPLIEQWLAPELTGRNAGTLQFEAHAAGSAPVTRHHVDDAAIAQHFEYLSDTRMAASYRRWQDDPSTKNALAYFVDAMASATQTAPVEAVISGTVVDGARPIHDALYRNIVLQWWMLERKRDDLAHSMITQANEPALLATRLLVRAFQGQMPTDDELGAIADATDEPSGAVALTIVLIRVFRADLAGARQTLERGRRGILVRMWGPELKLLLRLLGQEPSDTAEATARARDEAADRLARERYVVASYLLGLDLGLRGRTRAQRILLSSAAAMGRPGLIAGLLFDASMTMLKRNTARAAVSSSFLGNLDRGSSIEAGPLPWVGSQWEALGVLSGETRAEADRRIAHNVDLLIASRAVLAAIHLAAYGTSMFSKGACSERLALLADGHPVAAYGSVSALARAFEEGPTATTDWVRTRSARSESYLSTKALQVYVQFNPDRMPHAALEALIALMSEHRFLRGNEELSPGVLTEREHEIATLAGALTNVEIAERLGLSTRTVENYVSSALRKTGRSDRRALSEAAVQIVR